MLKKNLLLVLLSLVLSASSAFAQTASDRVDPDNYSSDALLQPLLGGINEARWAAGVDSVQDNEILKKAAQDLAERYAINKKIEIEPGFAGMLVKKYKGTNKVEEATVDASAGKAKNMLTYGEVASDAIEKFTKGKKFESIVKNPKYYYCGIASAINPDNKKVYIAIVFGGVDAFNKGAKDRKKLPIPFSKKKRGLSPYDAKDCKACDKFPDLEKLNQKVYVEGRYVYLEFDDFKRFKKFFRNAGDGLAVDIVTKEAYPCNGENIMDHNLNSKGLLLKPTYSSKLISKNMNNKEDPKVNTYKGVIGKIPKKYAPKLEAGKYEINLMYLLDRTVCKVMVHNYLEEGDADELLVLNVYPDTITSTDPKRYFPQNQDQELVFPIYFEQGKSTYDTKDIKSFIDALKEPQFIVNEIIIDAHSSLEGDSLTNAKLQNQRAQSIVDALQKYQNKKISNFKITTSDSWDMFKDSVKKTEYKDWAAQTKQQVKTQLTGEALTKLEPMLAKERFALITMKVTYDVTGKNEQAYVVSTYRKAIEKGEYDKAKKISRYIVQQIEQKRYEPAPFLAVPVPVKPSFASVLINKLFVDTKYNHDNEVNEAVADTLSYYYKTMSSNDFVAWNKYMAFVKTGVITDAKSITETQGRINELYNKTVPGRMTDGLNLEWQFKIIEKVDTMDAGTPNPTLQASMDRIKKIVNLDDDNWQNSLKLAYIFEKHGDLNYAMNLLAPYVTQDNPDEQLLFTYISIAAHFPDQIFSRNFRFAMQKASVKNKTRYCELFGSPKLTFQIKDNPNIKKQFCEACGN